MSSQQENTEPKKTMGDILKEDALAYAAGRKFVHRKHGKAKVTQEDMRKEVAVSRMIGEMSATERIINHLVLMLASDDYEKEPTVEKLLSLINEFQAALHIFVVDCGEAASEVMQTENIIGLEDVLEVHGYYKKYKKEE